MNKIGYLALAALVGTATAQPIEFVIDPARSTLDITIEIDLGTLGGDTDSDSTQLSGSIFASVDDGLAPSSITLHDFRADMNTALQYNWSPAFLSTAEATLGGGFVEYAEPGTDIGPVPVTDDAFEFLDVPTLLGGVLDVSYSIFLVGDGSQIIDLSTLGVTSTPISGEISSVDGTITVSNVIDLEASQPLVVDGTELGTVIVTGTATMVATADAPTCPADLNGDGQLDFFDISSFLTAFGLQEPIADFNNDGAWDFFDISGFLSAYSDGCP